jgi:hypothetical protein
MGAVFRRTFGAKPLILTENRRFISLAQKTLIFP